MGGRVVVKSVTGGVSHLVGWPQVLRLAGCFGVSTLHCVGGLSLEGDAEPEGDCIAEQGGSRTPPSLSTEPKLKAMRRTAKGCELC